MENCLVKKLKGSVNNSDLLPFGKFEFKVGANVTTPKIDLSIMYDGVNPVVFEVTGDVHIYNNNNTQQDSDGKYTIDTTGVRMMHFTAGAAGGSVTCAKYGLNSLNFAEGISKTAVAPTEDINSIMEWYDGSLSNILILGSKGNVTKSFIGKSGIQKFSAGNSVDVTGSLDNLSTSKSSLTNIYIINSSITGNTTSVNGTNLTGFRCFGNKCITNIEDFGSCTSLTLIHLHSNTSDEGEIINFVKAQIAAGRTNVLQTSPIACFFGNGGDTGTSNITFNGYHYMTNSGDLWWTSDGSSATIHYVGHDATVEL